LGSGERHESTNLPTILAGRAGGRLKSGQHLRYPRETPIANLWLSLARMMGVAGDRIGDSTGLLSDIMAT
jgi:hypothetical protein